MKLPEIKAMECEFSVPRYSFEESLVSLEENTLTFLPSENHHDLVSDKITPLKPKVGQRNQCNLDLKPINRALVPNIKKQIRGDRSDGKLKGSD